MLPLFLQGSSTIVDEVGTVCDKLSGILLSYFMYVSHFKEFNINHSKCYVTNKDRQTELNATLSTLPSPRCCSIQLWKRIIVFKRYSIEPGCVCRTKLGNSCDLKKTHKNCNIQTEKSAI